jgi:hypothetical protein
MILTKNIKFTYDLIFWQYFGLTNVTIVMVIWSIDANMISLGLIFTFIAWNVIFFKIFSTYEVLALGFSIFLENTEIFCRSQKLFGAFTFLFFHLIHFMFAKTCKKSLSPPFFSLYYVNPIAIMQNFWPQPLNCTRNETNTIANAKYSKFPTTRHNRQVCTIAYSTW